jgi:DnaJ like chaperone protein
MRIPFWIWIIIGLSLISWVVPDGIPGEEFILPALAVGSLLLRRVFMRGFYQQQYQQYQQRYSSGTGGAAGQYGPSGAGGAGGSAGFGNTSGPGSAGSFYGGYRNWGGGPQGAGFRQPQSPPLAKDPHAILGVAKGASMDEIKKAYREKLKKYHPDIVANLKLGEEYKEMFEEKTREIQLAYEQLGGR